MVFDFVMIYFFKNVPVSLKQFHLIKKSKVPSKHLFPTNIPNLKEPCTIQNKVRNKKQCLDNVSLKEIVQPYL